VEISQATHPLWLSAEFLRSMLLIYLFHLIHRNETLLCNETFCQKMVKTLPVFAQWNLHRILDHICPSNCQLSPRYRFFDALIALWWFHADFLLTFQSSRAFPQNPQLLPARLLLIWKFSAARRSQAMVFILRSLESSTVPEVGR